MKRYAIIRGVRNHGSEIEKWDEFTGDRREDALRGDLSIAGEEGCLLRPEGGKNEVRSAVGLQ